MTRRALVALALGLVGCSTAQLPGLDDGLAPPHLDAAHPSLLLPFSRIDVVGSGFAEAARASTRVRLRGNYNPTGGNTHYTDLVLPAQAVDAGNAFAVVDGETWQRVFGALGEFDGDVTVQSVSAVDGHLRESNPTRVTMAIADTVQPTLSAVAGGTLHINDAVVLVGDGFLLGTGEGETRAVVDGCFLSDGTPPGGSGCAGVAVHGVELVAHPLPSAPWDRTQAAFAFSPAIAGIKPGAFAGTVTARNIFASGDVKPAGTQALAATIIKPEIVAVSPLRASLGQFVDVSGGGFVGEAGDEVTLLHFVGSFVVDGTSKSAPVDLTLVPHFADGTKLRYVLDEADALGRLVDLRKVSGKFSGQVTPIVRKGNDEVIGATSNASLAIAPVKQIIYVRFLPSYIDSLRLYGLTAVDAEVRKRIFAVAARDYAGVNIEFRDTPPTDFALYSEVDVEGPDPNALGLLGYDNTPGKDVGNQRLFDRIGGVNATTQSDGFPGFGGIFAENFLGFSSHPAPRVARIETDSTRFDTVFDPLRPDVGTPVSGAELRALVPLGDGSGCLAAGRDRPTQIACAVFVLGNLVGSTLTHEVGHSLGLADPKGERFHDPSGTSGRLMNAGGDRPFEERAQLAGAGPAVFCDDEYSYLKRILPVADAIAGDGVSRPGCN
jgi:hypothetical protein